MDCRVKPGNDDNPEIPSGSQLMADPVRLSLPSCHWLDHGIHSVTLV
jgi:hypothetical protein